MRKLFSCFFCVIFFSCGKSDTVVNKYSNGNIKEEIPMKENHKNGIAKYYKENGSLDYEMEYRNDTVVGIIKEYYSNGKILREINVSNLDAKVYREDGRTYLKGHFDNKEMIMNGKWEEWLIDKNYKRFEWTYEDNEPDGSYTSFKPNGSIEVRGFYKKGTLDSILTYYDENGKKVKEEYWKANNDFKSSSLEKTNEFK